MKAIAAVLGRLRSVQLRFMLIVMLGALLFSALAGTVAHQIGRERALAASRKTIEGLVSAVEKTVAIGTYAHDRVLLQEIADGLVGNALVDSVEIQDVHGTRLAAGRNNGATEASAGRTPPSIQRLLVSPFDPAERIGQLDIRASEQGVGAVATDEAYTLGLMMAGQAALVALLLYGAAALLVSRPIVRLARQLARLVPGTAERLPTPALHGRDEIGRLIKGANAMLDATATALARERELRTAVETIEAQYRQIFESSSAGIFVLDASGCLINGNPTVSKVVGLSLDEMRLLRHDNFVQRVFGEPDLVRNMIERATRQGDTVSADLELVQRGEVRRWVHCLISVQGGSPLQPGMVNAASRMVEGVIYDITDRTRAEHAVRHRSEHDALTGLRNRASSDVSIERFVAEVAASGGQFSLLCIDLDGFKAVNDTLGHPAGDQVLVACAARMQAVVRRTSDLIGRMGGDEFVVALRDVGPEDDSLVKTAAALLEGLTQPFTLDDGTPVQIGASIGIACMPRHGTDRTALVMAADTAMYAVKRSGKNSFAMALLDGSAEVEPST